MHIFHKSFTDSGDSLVVHLNSKALVNGPQSHMKRGGVGSGETCAWTRLGLGWDSFSTNRRRVVEVDDDALHAFLFLKVSLANFILCRRRFVGKPVFQATGAFKPSSLI